MWRVDALACEVDVNMTSIHFISCYPSTISRMIRHELEISEDDWDEMQVIDNAMVYPANCLDKAFGIDSKLK